MDIDASLHAISSADFEPGALRALLTEEVVEALLAAVAAGETDEDRQVDLVDALERASWLFAEEERPGTRSTTSARRRRPRRGTAASGAGRAAAARDDARAELQGLEDRRRSGHRAIRDHALAGGGLARARPTAAPPRRCRAG